MLRTTGLAAYPTPESALSFLLADGEMAERIRQNDWSATALGPPARWSSTLKAMVRMALTTRHPIFIFWGREHICIYNDAYSASLGPEKHPSILGARARDAWPEIWTIIGPQIEMVLRGEGATWHENQLVPILRHGAIQDVYWTYSFGPIDDEDAPNGVGGVLVVCSETTAQVIAERRLATERERFAQLFEQAPSFMTFLQGPEHRIELANPGYMKLVGHRPVIGRTVAEALPEAVDQGYLRLLDQVYGSGAAVTATGTSYVARTQDGDAGVERFIDFVYQPIKDSAGAVTGIFVEGVDVTDRTLASQALGAVQAGLLRSEEQLRLATDAAEVGLWDVDLLTDTLFWPSRVKAMFGISPDMPVSMADFYAGLHPDDRAHTTAAFAAAMDPAQRALYDVEYRTIGKEDGVIRWVAAKGRALFDTYGKCIRVLGTAIDITARKSAETSLRESEARLHVAMNALKDADRNKDAFLATLGHEFRNPLATLRNSLTILEKARGNAEMTDRARQIMTRQVDQLARLTDDLLDVSRISLGKINLHREVLSIDSILAKAAESCATAIERGRQHLELTFAGPTATVHGDSARLVQLFGNLIGNASKFTPEGGRIDVVAGVDDSSVVISVKDSGIGLAADKLLCIFDAFTQLENPIGRSNSGLGIGLALSKQLVDMHGGSIEARSAGLGLGSEFLVRLPVLLAG
jgi:PAS domain S-box-containing protein